MRWAWAGSGVLRNAGPCPLQLADLPQPLLQSPCDLLKFLGRDGPIIVEIKHLEDNLDILQALFMSCWERMLTEKLSKRGMRVCA